MNTRHKISLALSLTAIIGSIVAILYMFFGGYK